MVYRKTKNIEGNINFKLGIVPPLIFSALNCLSNKLYLWAILLFIISAISIMGYWYSTKGEAKYIYNQYFAYNHHKKNILEGTDTEDIEK